MSRDQWQELGVAILSIMAAVYITWAIQNDWWIKKAVERGHAELVDGDCRSDWRWLPACDGSDTQK